MSAIEVLPPEVASGIAAGEVIDRPASAVRELIQNSLDAGATRIEVELEGAGLRTVTVRDDGTGMDAADAVAAFSRHATSKLSSLGDLATLTTHGFRGEALPSIAFAGDVEMVTRAAGSDAGTRVRCEAGGPLATEPAGSPPGTVVTVRRLFRNLPGRLKFMRGPAAETAACARIVSWHALARPATGFRLLVDGSERMLALATTDLRKRAVDVLGRDAEGFLAFSAEEGAYRVSGLVQAPGMVHGRSRQWLFVNGRPVEDRGLRYSLIAAYGGQVPRESSPAAIVLLALPPSRVDVNVHPAKTEVRFADQGAVYGLVSRTVRAAFGMPGIPGVPEAETGVILPMSATEGALLASDSRAATVLPFGNPAGPLPTLPTATAWPLAGQPAIAGGGGGLEIIGQLFLTYILARSGDNFLLVDQHAAHEKIVYERLAARPEDERASQELLVPHTLEVSAEESLLIERNLEDLIAAGIRLAPLGRGTWAVNSVPAEADEDAAVELARRVIGELSGAGRLRDREAVRHRALSVVACHLAVRAGQRLSDPEMEALIRELFALANPHSCPHGRPTFQRYGRADLERLFARRA